MNKKYEEHKAMLIKAMEIEKESLYLQGEALSNLKQITNHGEWVALLKEVKIDKSKAQILIRGYNLGVSKAVPVLHLSKLKTLVSLGTTEKVEEFVDTLDKPVDDYTKRELFTKKQEFEGKRYSQDELDDMQRDGLEEMRKNKVELPPDAVASMKSALREVDLHWKGVELTEDGKQVLEAITHIEQWITFLYGKMEDETLEPKIREFLIGLANQINNQKLIN